MAKKDKKAKKEDTEARTDPIEAVRAAVERALASAGGTSGARDRTRDLIDDFATFAGRFRDSLEELRVIDEVRSLRAEVEALSRRVGELESAAAKPAPSSASGRAAAGRTSRGSRAKPATGTAASSSGGTSRSAARPKTSTRAATSSRSGSSASRRPAAAKTSSTMAPKD